MVASRESSGIEDLDVLLGGLIPGDNIVWVSDDEECPRLFDLGSIAYWRVARRALGAGVVDEIRKVTQCVFEVGGGHLRVVKAEGRGPSVQGRLLRLEVRGETVRLENERALGRLGEGLRRLRQERHLSQGDLRAGDAVLATRAPIKGWRNLLGQSARLFWILRD